MPLVVKREEADRVAEETLVRMRQRQAARQKPPPDIITWSERRFFIPETGKPIIYEPYQKAILLYPITHNSEGRFPFSLVVYSTIKKSGKTTVAAAICRWFAETQTRFGEIYTMGNDLRQARERSFAHVKDSIQLTPGYRHKGNEGVLPDRWLCQTLKMDCLTSGTTIEAISVDAAGEAGSNPDLTCWCVSEDTEALTRHGFKLVHELTSDDEVATLNSTTGCMEWHHPRAVNVTHYRGKMVEFKHRRVSFMVTPNHRVYGKFFTNSRYTGKNGAAHKKKTHLDGWRVEEATVAAEYAAGELKANADWQQETYVDPRYARLVGYYIAEGTNANSKSATLCQNPGPVYEDMCKTAEALGYEVARKERWVVIRNSEFSLAMKKLGRSWEKYIPEELKNAQPEALRELFLGYMLGDGWGPTVNLEDACSEGGRCCTVSKKLSDDLLEVAMKIGHIPRLIGTRKRKPHHRLSYRLSFSTQPIYWERYWGKKKGKSHWGEVDYDGLVACPSIPHGIFYIRRNGKCCWTGNTELWGFESQEAINFFNEMTPVPNKESIRLVETYAGFEGESELLRGIYEQGKDQGRQLTAGEVAEVTGVPLGAFEEAPNADDLVPIWVNEETGLFMFWDSGIKARRMPWQKGKRGDKYYAQQAVQLPPAQNARLHGNEWVGGEGEFIPMELWDACLDHTLGPMEDGDKIPAVLSLDAATTADCFGAVLVTRHPEHEKAPAIRHVRLWTPPKGGRIDYDEPEAWIREVVEKYNLLEICYDPYQLEQMMRRLYKEGILTRAFDQGMARLIADSGFYKLIVKRAVYHRGNPDLRQHVQNAGSKIGKEEDSKLRIVKRVEYRKIDLCVAASMGCARILYYNL